MKPIVRNIIAVVCGMVVGGFCNMAIVQLGMSQYPANVDTNDMDAVGEFLSSAGIVFWLYPLIAHASHAFVGGLVAALISKNRKYGTALIVGGLAFLGGLMMVFVIPAPSWFVSADLIFAYFPMALLGAFLVKRLFQKKRK
ncbi:MAG: hypothetical protein ACFHU9_17280 [Fluviicola sp.]